MKLLTLLLAIIKINTVSHLSMNCNQGGELVLEDHSRWIVDPQDRSVSQTWLSPLPLQICGGGSKEYPYLLCNLYAEKKVKAKPAPDENFGDFLLEN